MINSPLGPLALSSCPSSPWNGKLVVSFDGLRVGAVDINKNEGGIWAWLENPTTIYEWEKSVSMSNNNLDRASDMIVEKFGGHSGYRPTVWNYNE